VATLTTDVRPLAEHDIPTVERALRRIPGSHRERLERQTQGEALYLFAWVSGEPVGHVLLVFASALGADSAHVEDLGVAEPWRGRKIGTQLMDRCEREALARGCGRMELDVGVDNDGARAFYAKRGYVEMSGQAPHLVRWPHLEASGAIGEGRELCTTFTKQLG
jgi:GNAT superfamily N-acetyltransferase